MPLPLILVEGLALGLAGWAYLSAFETKETEKHQDIAPIFPDEEDDQPKIITPQPINIYEDRSRTYVINIENESGSETIEIPRPRLPEEADNQTDTPTPRGKSIDIKKSVHKHTFGKLLINPLEEKLKVFEYNAPMVAQDFKEAQEKGIQTLKTYFSNRDEESKILEKNLRIEELGMLILPEEWRGFSGELGMIYGHEALSIINRNYTVRSTTAFMTPRIKAYKDYEKIQKTPKEERTKIKQPEQNQEVELSVCNLGRIYDFLGIDTLYRVLDPKLEVNKLLEKFGNALNLQPSENTEDEPTYKSRSWGIASLLEFNTALISNLFWKLGLQQFPAQVPKDLSNLPSFEETESQGIKERDLDSIYFGSDDKENLYQEVEDKDTKNLEENVSEEFKKKYYHGINSLGEYIAWQSKQVDALTGAFPITIDIKDTDLIQVGEQGKRIQLPNISETLAELMGQTITQGALIDALLNITLRNLQETGSTRVQSITSYRLIEAISDYLGFKLAKKQEEVDFTFDPTHGSDEREKESIAKALTPKKIKVAVEEYDDEESLERHMVTLLEAARIIKARYWRKVDLKDKNALKDLYKSALDVLNGDEDKPKDGQENDPRKDFDRWLEDLERGFIDAPGITDKERPYGRDFEQRPRAREIGEDVTD